MPSAAIIDPFVASDYQRSALLIPSLTTLNNELPYHFQAQSSAMNNDPLGKKSQNMTECVPVPSSEHVAEIVGRQGCKIKALRAKTNTYIKTPVRGDEPVFIITGRKEDVFIAKKEILSAAEHFSQIRAGKMTTTTSFGLTMLYVLPSSQATKQHEQFIEQQHEQRQQHQFTHQ